MIKKITVFIMSICLLMSACGCKPAEETEEKKNEYVSGGSTATAFWQDGSAFTPVLRFVVASDIHVRDWYTVQSDMRLGYVFDDAYAYAATQEYDRVDAFIFNGDLTENGTDIQFSKLNSIIQSKIRQEESLLLMPYAGHDILTYYDYDARAITIPESALIERMESLTGNDSGMHVTINGFHFITVSTMRVGQLNGGGELVTGYDEEWIREQLSSAQEEDAYKPIFMFYHHPMEDTVMSTAKDTSVNDDTYYNPRLYGKDVAIDYAPSFSSVMKNYTQLVYFGGHYHSALKNPLTVVQKDYTSVDTGSVYYVSRISDNFLFSEGGPNKAYGKSSVSSMWIVEVDADYRIRLLPYDLEMHRFYNGIGAESDRQTIKYIQDASDPNTWIYTKDARVAKADIPAFAEDAQISVTAQENGVSLSFPQAADNDGVDSYWLEVKNVATQETVKRYAVSSQYFLSVVPERLNIVYEITGSVVPTQNNKYIDAGTYEISLTPYDIYGKAGQSIKKEFTV